MESQASLALMAKAKLVFERDDTFLAFPLTPLVFDPAQLSFTSDDEAGNVAHLHEFSALVDHVPNGPLWDASDDRRLSDIYLAVLGSARLAQSTRTHTEEETYQQAWALLHTPGDDGLPRDTALYLAYQRCRDAYFMALEDFKNAQIAGESSTDPATQRRWKDVDEPLYQGRVDAAKDRWDTEGGRPVVEQAKEIVATLGAKSAALAWAHWQSQCNPDLDFQTDPASNQPFAPSFYAPANAIASGSWQRFTLDDAEVDRLAKQAPPELRARFGDVVDLDVDSLSFEYSSAGVSRAWFSSDVFRSRFWRLNDPGEVISDGANPPHGRCPAYIAGVVFARSMDVKLRAGSPRNEVANAKLAAGEPLRIGPFGATRTQRLVTRGSAAALRRAPALTAAAPPGRYTAVQATMPRIAESRACLRMQSSAFNRAPGTVLPAANPGNPAITVLAFICKRFPRSPDPDPALKW